jgi:hypothetical protein
MSEFDNVISLANGLELRTQKELIAYTNAQYLALHAISEKVKELESKNKHLEELLDATNTSPIIKTLDQCIVEEQIERLRTYSLARQLSAEEIKSLDVLIRNRLLLYGQATTIPGEVKKKKDLSPAQLTLIAKKEK